MVARSKMNIGTGLPSNRRRKEASRSLSSVMSTRRPMMPPSLVRRSSIRMQRPSASHCSWRSAGLLQLGEALGEPFLLAAFGGRIVAAHDADAQRVSQARADFEQVGAAVIDLGVLLVPEEVAAFRCRERRCPEAASRGLRAGVRARRALPRGRDQDRCRGCATCSRRQACRPLGAPWCAARNERRVPTMSG